MTPFSFSRLDNYEGCPKRFHALSIAKSVKEPESDAMRVGKDTHKALERRVGMAKALPSHLTHLEPLAAAFAAAPGRKLCEFQMAINESMQPTGWFDKDVYCRAIADLVIVNRDKAILVDYKTGKKSNNFLQLKLTASVLFQHEPKVNTIHCAFVWTQDQSSTRTVLARDEIAEVWTELAPRIQRYQNAFDQNDFPPRPNWRCKGCPVKTCQYWEEPRR